MPSRNEPRFGSMSSLFLCKRPRPQKTLLALDNYGILYGLVYDLESPIPIFEGADFQQAAKDVLCSGWKRMGKDEKPGAELNHLAACIRVHEPYFATKE